MGGKPGYRNYNDPINSFELNVKRGLVPGMRVVRKFGANAAVGTVEEDIYAGGGLYPWPTAAETIRVKAGGNANDTSAGTGARTVRVFGLDASFEEINEDIILAGASASSATTALFIRVYRAYVLTVGTYGGNNVANVEIENTTSGNVLANIEAGMGQTQLSMYTVPAGKTAYLDRIFANVSSGKACDVYFYQRQNADVVSAPFTGKRLIRPIYGLDGPTEFNIAKSVEFPEKTDLWWSAAAATGTSSADCGYELLEVDN